MLLGFLIATEKQPFDDFIWFTFNLLNITKNSDFCGVMVEFWSIWSTSHSRLVFQVFHIGASTHVTKDFCVPGLSQQESLIYTSFIMSTETVYPNYRTVKDGFKPWTGGLSVWGPSHCDLFWSLHTLSHFNDTCRNWPAVPVTSSCVSSDAPHYLHYTSPSCSVLSLLFSGKQDPDLHQQNNFWVLHAVHWRYGLASHQFWTEFTPKSTHLVWFLCS